MDYKNKIIDIIKDIGTIKAAFSNENTGSEDNQNVYNCLVDSIVSLTKAKKLLDEYGISSSNDDYGFYWDGDYIYDKYGYYWYFGDYINNTGIEPYTSYIEAVKETENHIEDSFKKDEISDPEYYANQLVDFVIETLPDPGKFIKEYEGFVKSSRKPIKSSRDEEEIEILERGYRGHQVQHDEGAWILDQDKRFWNLTDLKEYVDERYNDDDDDEISSSANRNRNNLNSIFNG